MSAQPRFKSQMGKRDMLIALTVRAVPSFLGLATAMTLQSQAEFRATQISAGRYDRVVSAYMYPLPVVYNGRCSLAGTQREAWSFFQSLHSSMIAKGLTQLCATVTAQEVPRAGRFRIWTDWIGYGDGGSETLVAQTICSCSGPVGAHLIEMIQFTHLSLPDLAEAIG